MIANNPQPEFENQNVHKVLLEASRGLELAAPNGADIHRRTNCAQRLLFERENLERRGLTGLTFKELSQQAPDMHTRIMNSVVEVRTYGVRI